MAARVINPFACCPRVISSGTRGQPVLAKHRPERRSGRSTSHFIHCAQSSNGSSNTQAQQQPDLPTFSSTDTVSKSDYGKFVRFLHLASPYVVGHRARVFVLVIPGEVMSRKDRLIPLLEDIMLLHGLGVRLVIVAGAKELIDKALMKQGIDPTWVGAYRVTSPDVMKIAIEAAGSLCTEISAHLSKAPSIPMVRRHARGEGQNFHFAPAVQVISGNYVTAKRRGIVNGVDFGLMGQVRFVQRNAIQQQLDSGNIVLLTNVGVSASGELLNCNSYDVATHAAVELQADKMLCITGSDVRALRLPHYLPLDDAEALIQTSLCGENGSAEECLPSEASLEIMGRGRVFSGSYNEESGGSEDADSWIARRWGSSSSSSSSSLSSIDTSQVEMLLDLDSWQQIGFPNAVVASVVACRQGVKRAHLVDIDQDGAMLLELYTRDGITGVCMIAADLYEGIRPAELDDVPGVSHLLGIMASRGHELAFPPEHAGDYLSSITVLEREGKVLGCAVATDLGRAPDGLRVVELSSFVIDPSFRRQGLGDSLLDYVEQGLRKKGFNRVVVVADQGSYEWFMQRAFEPSGTAVESMLIPEERRNSASPVSKLLVKPILELDASLDAPAGKRIGF